MALKAPCPRGAAPVKVMVSLAMAFILFFSSPSVASAAPVAGAGLSVKPYNYSLSVPLQFFGNYTKEGSDRDSMIPYTYRGDLPFVFDISRSAGPFYSYVSGTCYVQATFEATGIPASSTPGFLVASIQDAQVPEGLAVSLQPVDVSAGSAVYNIRFDFDRFYVGIHRSVGFTLHFDTYVLSAAKNFGASYSVIILSSRFSGDFVDTGLAFHSDLTGLDPDVSWFHAMVQNIYNSAYATSTKLDTVNSRLQTTNTNLVNIYNRQNTINNTINALKSAVLGKVQEQIDSGDRNSQAEVDAANRNSQAEVDAANRNSQAEVDAANRNSQAEIDAANKNAGDIMNSYDSTSQEGDNERLDASQKQLEETESSLFESALTGFSGLDLADYSFGKFTQMAAAFSFVSSMLQSFYINLGDFGLVVTIGLVIMVASKVLGIYRFSTGGGG